jgi:hypothetical protein
MDEHLNKQRWKEGETTAYGFSVQDGLLTGGSGAWPIKRITAVQYHETAGSGMLGSLGWGKAMCVSIAMDGKEIEILKVESSPLDGEDLRHLKWQMCNQVVNLIKFFLKAKSKRRK